MVYRLLLILLFITPVKVIFSQEIPIGDWRDHLPYTDAVSITYGNGVAYCATSSAVFTYNSSDHTIDRLNLINGLSDIGLTKIKFNDYNNTVIIAYANGNLDVIDQNNNITNLSYIKTSSIIANKRINHIYIKNNLAYLSTGFGIVVLDTDAMEIADTYLFGPLGAYVYTNAVTIDSLYIYAATDIGVFYADKNSQNLIDYNQWSLLPDLGALNYNNIVTFSGRVFASYNSPNYLEDSVYYNDGGVWQLFRPGGYNVENINVSKNQLLISYSGSVEKHDYALLNFLTLYTFNNQFPLAPLEAVLDDNNYVLMADKTHGMIRSKDNWDTEIIVPNGPSSPNCFKMDFVDNELWLVSGGYGTALQDKLINHYSNGTWSNLGINMTNIQGGNASDMVSVAINPSNKTQVFLGSWRDGLFEYNSDMPSNIYTAQNSPLDSAFFGITAVGGLEYDKDNNLWISCSFTDDVLSVKMADNNWYSFSFPGKTNATEEFRNLLIDQNNYKWLLSLVKNQVLVFDDNGTPEDPNDDRSVVNGNLPGSSPQCFAEDLDGEIWVGTDEGIGVFYNPSSIFDETISAEPIYIQQDGQTQILLETETITAIEIDGANRKWIGTQNSGVYLLSADGTEEVEHFTTGNSPLFSNTIFDIEINPVNGEIYFGTANGLISYKGTATDADDDFNNVFVYPNPVKPDFHGTIAIRGLVKDTDVRITDISGNIVYQTTSLGGQAVWDGNDFNGNRVQTGVYMIFNGSPEGELKAAAKILFIN